MTCTSLRTLSSSITLTIAALCLAAGALLSSAPAAAASGERAGYCLSGDGTADCGFTSLAQCEASASGGLGVCNIVSAGLAERSRAALSRGQAR
jgi:hypothetical protein